MTQRLPVAVTTLGDLLVRAAQARPDRDAFVTPSERINYYDLLAQAEAIARSLVAMGLQQGDHVGLLLPNSVAYVAGFFGISLAGCAVVPLNARHKATELGYTIQHAELRAILTSRHPEDSLDFPQLLQDALPSMSSTPSGTDLVLEEAPLLRSIALLRGKPHPSAISPTDFAALGEGVDRSQADIRRRRVRVRDTALLVYTSGTTAKPKGCMLTHEAAMRGPDERMRERYWAGDHNVTWAAGPLFHIGSLGPLIGSVAVSGTFLTDVHYQPGPALKLMASEGVTLAWPWFPAIIQGLLDHPDFEPGSLPHLRFVNAIAVPDLMSRLQSQLPRAEVMQSCGMTETAGIFAIAASGEPDAVRIASNGKASPGVEIKIMATEEAGEVPDGTAGEIWVRGYCVMEGYWRDPVATAAALTADGWLKTGDLYERRTDGNVIFRGRLKDMLKVGGENVSPAEVEAYLCSHPDVRTAEVVGRPDERLDEVPVAFIELSFSSTLTAENLIGFCQGRIASYKVPREVIFMQSEDWPMSLTKVDKRALRQRLTLAAR